MSASRIFVSTLLSCFAFQAAASDVKTTVVNQVNLSVVRYDDHYLVECSPKDDGTSQRNDWKAICNEMAAPQINTLVAEGKIAPVTGPVFDLAKDIVTSDAVTGQALSKKIPLAP